MACVQIVPTPSGSHNTVGTCKREGTMGTNRQEILVDRMRSVSDIAKKYFELRQHTLPRVSNPMVVFREIHLHLHLIYLSDMGTHHTGREIAHPGPRIARQNSGLPNG